MRIAQVAVKYQVPMVKLTGGQRIDLLGIKKADLPGVWKDLGMPSGHAYTKAMRTCKSCVGTDFCRYGVGDSIGLAQKIERRFQGVESPHKMKLATAGCPRNCSEAYVKDLGAVAIEGGRWEIYVGGAAGGSVRKGDLLCTVDTEEDVLLYMGRFIQYYREHGRYLERSYGFVERIGIENLRKILIEDSLGTLRAARRGNPESRGRVSRSVAGGAAPRVSRAVQRGRARLRAGGRREQWLKQSRHRHQPSIWAPPAESPRVRAAAMSSDPHEIAVFRQRDGRLFATENRCPHNRARSPKVCSAAGGSSARCTAISSTSRPAPGVSRRSACGCLP